MTTLQRLTPAHAQQAFRALLAAAAEPGTLHTLPAAVRWAKTLIVPAVLADDTTSVAICGDIPSPQLSWLETTTGARLIDDPAAADFVVLADGPAAVIPALRRGSNEHPEHAAKLVIACTRLDTADGDIVLRLTGPGIAGTTRLAATGIVAGAADAVRAANPQFPVGLDAWLVDDHGRIAALPRSTHIEKER
ncbi:phosphonate C-P lyase system protein PhnH [Nocardia sp. NPDC004711]